MPQFQSKHATIEAVQLSWLTWNDVCSLIERTGGKFGQSEDAWKTDPTLVGPGRYIGPDEVSDTCGEPGPEFIAIDVPTMHGERATVRHGDWLVPDGKPGTFYPVKPEIFAKRWEPLGTTRTDANGEIVEPVQVILRAFHDSPMASVLRDVAAERFKQLQKWSPEHDVEHTPSDWVNLRADYEGRALDPEPDATTIRDSLVKVAALALAQVEAFDRVVAQVQSTESPEVGAGAEQR